MNLMSIGPAVVTGAFGICTAVLAAKLASRAERKRFDRDLTTRLEEVQRDFATQYAAAAAVDQKHAAALVRQFAGAFLYIRNPELTTSDRRFIARGARTMIGRSGTCDLVMPDSVDSISQVHAMFEFLGDKLYLTDLDSKNGTFLNDVRIEGRIAVMHGSTIRLGTLEMTLHLM